MPASAPYTSIARLADADRAAKEHKDESDKGKEQMEALRNELQEERDALRDSLKNAEMQARELDRLRSDLDKASQVRRMKGYTLTHFTHDVPTCIHTNE